MTTGMGPPPPRNPNSSTMSNEIPSAEVQTKTLDEPSTSEPAKTPMGPPPPQNPNTPKPDPLESLHDAHQDQHPICPENGSEPIVDSTDKHSVENEKEQLPNAAVPYTIPPWSEPPCHHYFLEVLKDGSIIDQFNVYEKGAYMFGRIDLCDFVLEHPTISRFHAVLQFKRNGDAYLYDLGSTHGTSVNKNQVKKKVYVELHVGDVLRFGQSSRLYIFQGPSELMLPERDLKSIRNAKMREDMQDMEASLLRAKLEASLADGVSWGMCEDAIEEAEDDAEEITWQTYKGQLTERQEKTRDKIIKRLEKIANMKKEIDAIRVKDISQGGLTQGQQTQIARNEQRTSQIMEELENLEETLNESIRESMGARSGRMSRNKKKGAAEEDDEEYFSDDDDFYDRTKKRSSSQKGGENQSVETADSLLDKKDAISKQMEEKKKLLQEEEDRIASENEAVTEVGDTLEAYMSGLSSQLVADKTNQLQTELSSLQSELDRILYLLNIADPTGEASRNRELKAQEPKPTLLERPNFSALKQPSLEQNRKCGTEKSISSSIKKSGTTDATTESNKKAVVNDVADATEGKTTVYTIVKPQWLGAIEEMETKETQPEKAPENLHESEQFVDYKDRNKILGNLDAAKVNADSDIENAAPGLIIRKRKQAEKSDGEVKVSEQLTCSSVGTEIRAEDAVALLLKHKRGYHTSDDEIRDDGGAMPTGTQSRKDNKKPKKKLGPERPSFLDDEVDYESWVPPEGQSGDGRTTLNDRLGY
ncbi:uncharacterized protein LOC132286542 [Cornus florida]|uniref:uncharacterized protein LOC132286542 n=1 Tax=Cornus florida TaxID=4283 RepID=UPI0028A24EC6|nr:uncharacterized protein LOC132286542 [Cornus florida]